jgi:1-acyl-sn-glycerol-3-phosphate acyltransferase
MTGKSALFVPLARWYVRRRLGKNFQDVLASGLSPLREKLASGPALLACNHVSWWDPLVMVHLDACLSADGYCLMDQENLGKLPFFSWVGAVPLDRTSRKAAYGDLRAAAQLLDRPSRFLLTFPQGEQRAAHLPLSYKAGIFFLARLKDVPVYPLALRYDFHESPRALVHLSVGQPLFARSRRRDDFLRNLEAATQRELERIDGHLSQGEGSFSSLLGRSTNLSAHELPVGASVLRRLSPSPPLDSASLREDSK